LTILLKFSVAEHGASWFYSETRIQIIAKEIQAAGGEGHSGNLQPYFACAEFEVFLIKISLFPGIITAKDLKYAMPSIEKPLKHKVTACYLNHSDFFPHVLL